MGSSVIRTIIIGTTGPTGPSGPTGPIGSTGTGIGLTGGKGKTGRYVTAIGEVTVGGASNTLIVFSVPPSSVILNTKGPTGYTGTIFGQNISSGLTFFKSSSGYTLNLRGISFIGKLTAEVTGDSILVTPLDVLYGVTLSSNTVDGKITFSKTDSIIGTSRISYGKTSGAFSFSNSKGITENSSQVYSDVYGNLISVPSGSNNLILGITNGAIYKITTPIGLSGFTLDPSIYGDNELISVTLLVEGNGFTQFPSNVYFEDSPYSSNFGCGMNIMNLMTNNKGSKWYATIVERGYGATLCKGFDGVGSCCYLYGNTLTCNEYVTEDWCNERFGSFNLFQPCDLKCGPTAICCSNGHCVSGVSEQECLYFGGKYYTGLVCDNIEYNADDDNTIRQCYDSTKPTTSCCVGVTCISNVTFQICKKYYNGTPFVGNCCDFDCVSGSPIEISGACCVSENKSCIITSPVNCSERGGIFFGTGTTCDEINCCFDEPKKFGACCKNDGSCQDNVEKNACLGFATFYEGASCGNTCVPVSNIDYQSFVINIPYSGRNPSPAVVVNCGGNPEPCFELGDHDYLENTTLL